MQGLFKILIAVICVTRAISGQEVPSTHDTNLAVGTQPKPLGQDEGYGLVKPLETFTHSRPLITQEGGVPKLLRHLGRKKRSHFSTPWMIHRFDARYDDYAYFTRRIGGGGCKASYQTCFRNEECCTNVCQDLHDTFICR